MVAAVTGANERNHQKYNANEKRLIHTTMKTEDILRVVDISWRQVHQHQINLVVHTNTSTLITPTLYTVDRTAFCCSWFMVLATKAKK
jgi:hypothetical protein